MLPFVWLLIILLFEIIEHLFLFLKLIFQAPLKRFRYDISHSTSTRGSLGLKWTKSSGVSDVRCILVAVLSKPLFLLFPHLADDH
jgi:hypothetical protein